MDDLSPSEYAHASGAELSCLFHQVSHQDFMRL